METIQPEQIKTEVVDELYKGHEIKEEMAIGPVVLQGGSGESSGGDYDIMTNLPDHKAAKPETEDVTVKSEQEGLVFSVKKEVPELYEEHEIKEEMVTGPVMLQQSSVVDDVYDGPLQTYPNTDSCKMNYHNSHNITTPSVHTHMEHDLKPKESQQPTRKKEYNVMTCKVYSTEYKTKMSLTQHKVLHKNGPFVCNYCQKVYKRKADMVYHIRAHTGEYEFKCSICGEKFPYRHNLGRHLQTHVRANWHRCKVCSKTFSLLCDLKAHQSTHNTEDEHVFCDICQEQLKRTSMSQHYKTHSGVKPFKCDFCEKRFCTKRNLQNHQVIHVSVKPYQCHVCEKGFYSKEGFKRHLGVHSSVKCDICHKCFSRKSILVKHQQTHTGEKPYSCKMCGNHFKSKDYVKIHMYKCPNNSV